MWIRCRSVKNWKLVIQLNERKVSCEGYQKQIGSGAFFFLCSSCPLFSHLKWPDQEGVLHTGKETSENVLFQEGKTDWGFRLMIFRSNLSTNDFINRVNRKKSRDTVFILLNSSSDRLSSGRAIASRLDLICCDPSYRERGSSPSHWGTAKTSWKSSSMIAKFCP